MEEHISVSKTSDFHLLLHSKEVSHGYEHETGAYTGEHWYILELELA